MKKKHNLETTTKTHKQDLSTRQKTELDSAVKKTVKQYKKTLQLLAKT